MSSQKGNVARSRGQRYQNSTAFKNDRHGATVELKKVNAKIHDGLCQHCKGVLEWKVKYKKYKPLTTAKKCVKCCQKTVKDAYHIICRPCALQLEICCKCGKKEEIVIPINSHLSKNEQNEDDPDSKKQGQRKRSKGDLDSEQSEGFDDDDDDEEEEEEEEVDDCDLGTKRTQSRSAVLPDVSQMNVKE